MTRAAKNVPHKKAGSKQGRGSVSLKTRQILWARSGGICAMPGCSAPVLHRSPMHFLPSCFGELAHNVAASPDGPRGDPLRSSVLVDDPDNLIMMCPSCHTVIDEGGAANFPEALLRQWKTEHEAAIELLGSIKGDKRARVLICTGKIRGAPCNIEIGAALQATIRAGYRPIAAPSPIALFDRSSADGSPDWWKAQAFQLVEDLKVAMNTQRGRETALAVFAIAEMPTLILLGFLLGDEQQMIPFQSDRSSGGSCDFQDLGGPAVGFTTTYPASIGREGVALVLSITAPIDHERVVRSVGADLLPIVEIRANEMGRQMVKSLATVEAFRRCVIDCIDRIEQLAGTKIPISVFPAMPAPLAVAFGATIMPKAPLRLSIFDSSGVDGLFAPAITLP